MSACSGGENLRCRGSKVLVSPSKFFGLRGSLALRLYLEALVRALCRRLRCSSILGTVEAVAAWIEVECY